MVSKLTDRAFMQMHCKVATQIGDGHLRVLLLKVHKDSIDSGNTALAFRLYVQDRKSHVYKCYNDLSPIFSNDHAVHFRSI